MLRPKKKSYKEFDNEKKFLRLKNSPPPAPHNFSNGPSLTGTNESQISTHGRDQPRLCNEGNYVGDPSASQRPLPWVSMRGDFRQY